MNSPDHFRRSFEELGEAKVRQRLALKDFGDIEMRLAPEWLREKEEDRARLQAERSDASQVEQIDIARSAKDAAWAAAEAARDAAREAKNANRLAVIANVIAAAAMIVAGIALIKSIGAS